MTEFLEVSQYGTILEGKSEPVKIFVTQNKEKKHVTKYDGKNSGGNAFCHLYLGMKNTNDKRNNACLTFPPTKPRNCRLCIFTDQKNGSEQVRMYVTVDDPKEIEALAQLEKDIFAEMCQYGRDAEINIPPFVETLPYDNKVEFIGAMFRPLLKYQKTSDGSIDKTTTPSICLAVNYKSAIYGSNGKVVNPYALNGMTFDAVVNFNVRNVFVGAEKSIQCFLGCAVIMSVPTASGGPSMLTQEIQNAILLASKNKELEAKLLELERKFEEAKLLKTTGPTNTEDKSPPVQGQSFAPVATPMVAPTPSIAQFPTVGLVDITSNPAMMYSTPQ